MRPTNAVVMVMLAVACQSRDSSDRPAADTTRAANAMVMRSDSLIPRMRAHLDSLATATATLAAQSLAAHEAMASELLDAMGSDMAMMGMRGDSAWNALTDSIKGDLAELTVLSGEALATRVRAHIGRMRRLLDMHAAMM